MAHLLSAEQDEFFKKTHIWIHLNVSTIKISKMRRKLLKCPEQKTNGQKQFLLPKYLSLAALGH